MKKKLLAALLAVCMVASMLFVPATAAATFDDVAEDHWASESIERWAGYGVLTGHGDGTFNPDGPMSREQFASMMVKLLGLTKESGKTFVDVTDSFAWAEKDVDKVATAGIVQGYTDGSFGAGRPVSFESAAVMMSRALGLVTIEESTGTNWADTTVEKLDDLGMLDDNVNADADANRALVAALANNMIGTYVTPDTVGDVTEDGVITGEVSGIILVVGEVEVDIKDATVAAPIVVQGASVTLTNTTAANVKVGGENASVTADEDSTVADVIVGGSDTKVELNGEVTGSVTVAADAAGEVEIVAPEDVEVTNESPVDVTVNGETVEGKPVEEDPENPDDESSTGFVPNPSTPATNPEVSEDTTPKEPEIPAASTGKVEEADEPTYGEGETAETHTHDFSGDATVDSAATCTASGTAHYACSCGATSSVTIPALGHKEILKEENLTAADCTTAGSAKYTCANTGCDYERTETISALGHQMSNKAAVPATCEATGMRSGIVCTREGCDKDGSTADAFISGGGEVAALGHSWKKVTTTVDDVEKVSWECTREGCDATSEAACPDSANHANILTTAKCPLCGEAGSKEPPVAHTGEHTVSYDSNKSDLITDTQHPTKCGTANCTYEAGTMVNHTFGAWTSAEAEGTTTYTHTCTECKKAVSTTTKPADYDTNNSDSKG